LALHGRAPVQRQRRHFISAWGNAPGNSSTSTNRALKARFNTLVTDQSLDAWCWRWCEGWSLSFPSCTWERSHPARALYRQQPTAVQLPNKTVPKCSLGTRRASD